MSFEVKYNIGFGIPIEFPRRRKISQIAIGISPESLKSIGQFLHTEINKKDLTVSYVRTDRLTLNVEKLRF